MRDPNRDGAVPELPASVADDIAATAEAQALSAAQTTLMARIIAGAVRGNRDRPLFLLARAICALPDPGEGQMPFALIIEGAAGALPRRADRALLDFLLSMDDHAAFAEIDAALGRARRAGAEGAPELARCLARCLYRYRRAHLPGARHQGAFLAIRRHLQAHRPEDPAPRDGDALDFWQAHASRHDWTLYRTAYEAMAQFDEAMALAASWRAPLSLDSQVKSVPCANDSDMPGNEAPALMAAAQALAEAPIKLFLAHELDALRALAATGAHAARWPFSTLALWSLGPCQGAAVQHLRQGDDAPPPETLACQAAPGYDTLRRARERLCEQARDWLRLWLARASSGAGIDLPPALSTSSQEAEKRMRSMLRRKSLAGTDPAALTDCLARLHAPLLDMQGALDRMLTAWARHDDNAMRARFQDDRARFASVMVTLYGAAAREGGHVES